MNLSDESSLNLSGEEVERNESEVFKCGDNTQQA